MKTNNKPSKYIILILLIIWMAVIFMFSSEGHTISKSRSDGIIQTVASVVHIEPTEFEVRKAAHLTAYVILGALMLLTVKDKQWATKKLIILSILFCYIYACTDEIHQAFVPGRGPLLTDVLIDTAGATVGVVLSHYTLSRHRKRAPLA